VIECSGPDEFFLISGETDSIYHEKVFADAIYRLAGVTVVEAEMIRPIPAAISDVGPENVTEEVRKLLGSAEHALQEKEKKRRQCAARG